MENNKDLEQRTKFNSILPLIIQARVIIFGEKRPEIYTRFTFYFNTAIWFVFLSWHLISYLSISLRDLIFVEKKIDVEALIFARGKILGFRPYEFLNLLLSYHITSAICWGTIFIGLILMWRKKKIFNYFIFVPFLAYVLMILFFLRWRYFMEDTTFFDKISLLIFVLNILVYSIVQHLKKKVLIIWKEIKYVLFICHKTLFTNSTSCFLLNNIFLKANLSKRMIYYLKITTIKLL